MRYTSVSRFSLLIFFITSLRVALKSAGVSDKTLFKSAVTASDNRDGFKLQRMNFTQLPSVCKP